MIEVSQFVPFGAVCVFIALDVVSGIVKACSLHTLSSTVMRAGLWHKCASILLVITALAVSQAVTLIPGMPSGCEYVYVGICVYIVGMELISILENVCAANPELSLAKLFELFHVNNGDGGDGGR